jgi:2-polyprenyl-3-methyl-5-hydroxy-6-metoxy-1,4-benzoquinol methylase
MEERGDLETGKRIDRGLRNLARSVAARCRGRTLLAGGRPAFAALLREREVEVVQTPPISGPGLVPPAEGPFETVVPGNLLDRDGATSWGLDLEHSWELVAPGGRLMVAVPNRDALRGREREGGIRERELKKELRTYGRARLATDQPFRWLLAHVDRSRDGGPARPGRTRMARYRATAALCRGRVVELGCGEGHLARLVHDRGLEVVGVDLNAGKIRTARRLHPEIPFLCSDIRQVDLRDASFDTAILAEVLEHVPEDVGDRIVERTRRLVRPGGRLIVSVPNRGCIPHPNHVRRFDRRSLGRMLRPIGRPRLVVEQPYQWLMMWVTKGG